MINFIEVIREDTPEKLKPYEEICIQTHGEAKKLLAQAIREQEKKNFDLALENDISQKQEGTFLKEFDVALDNAQARYVRVKAKSVGVCLPWHAGAGEKVWLFCDEIVIQEHSYANLPCEILLCNKSLIYFTG